MLLSLCRNGLLLALAIPLAAAASPIAELNVFQNNTPADATEVNENFADVKTAVNDNDSRITAVETGTAAAQTSAGAAQSTADAAQTSAAAAQSTADAAQTSAGAAQSTADAAQTSADAAQSTADAAQSTADTAATSASAAATTASNAQGSADSAQAAISSHTSPGCTVYWALAPGACPFVAPDLLGYNALSNCEDAPIDSLCEGDGECGTDTELNNCEGGYDVYYKAKPS